MATFLCLKGVGNTFWVLLPINVLVFNSIISKFCYQPPMPVSDIELQVAPEKTKHHTDLLLAPVRRRLHLRLDIMADYNLPEYIDEGTAFAQRLRINYAEQRKCNAKHAKM